MKNSYGRIVALFATFLAAFVGLRYLLPLTFPFLLGAGLAWLAEPVTQFLCKKLPRGVSAGISVTAAFCCLAMLIVLAGALLLRQLGQLGGILPQLEDSVRAGINTLSGWLQDLTLYAPGKLGAYLSQSIGDFFSGGTALLERAGSRLLALAGSLLSHVPDSAFSLGTALISSYMIAAKLPRIRGYLHSRLQKGRLRSVTAGFRKLRTALWGWLKAQAKLSGVSWVIIFLGFVVLRIPYAPLWSLLVVLVDAFPVLGTGTVLIPWSLICLLQGEQARGIGLLGVYAVVTVTRSVLEPRLVGRQLGLDPLATLFALYAGYKIWGLGGMLLAPMLAGAAVQLLPPKDKL